jgi:hypothetical protein
MKAADFGNPIYPLSELFDVFIETETKTNPVTPGVVLDNIEA